MCVCAALGRALVACSSLAALFLGNNRIGDADGALNLWG